MTDKLRESISIFGDRPCYKCGSYNCDMSCEAALAEPAIKESLTVQRPWVGLTDEEIDEIGKAVIGFNSLSGWENEFGLAIEAKLREKNT